MRAVLCLLVSSMLACLACEQPPSQGQQLYTYYCANCHMPDGTGLEKLIPPVADSDYLNTHWTDLACLIRNGQSESIVVNGVQFSEPMPANPKLTDTEIINIISYIQREWYPGKEVQNPADVRNRIKNCSN